MRYTLSQAQACARIIKAAATIPVAAYVFGSCTNEWGGSDVDLMFEVDTESFGDYLESSHLDGVHPHLKGVDDPDDMYWLYFSPKKERSKAVLETIGINIRNFGNELEKIVSLKDVDLICLPSDWRDRDGSARKRLDEMVSGNDPEFFIKLEQTAQLVE